ncbi:hypothetical protein QE152_g2042 [Popillia japonica]|uniref:Uncharacterized protein n=1 Tax=Popillia japonica TaxID=7064 RepID=A0AAW1N0D0_POPJA
MLVTLEISRSQHRTICSSRSRFPVRSRSQGSSDDRDAIAPITNRPHFDPLVDPHLLTYEVERWENRFEFETRPLRVPIDPCAEALTLKHNVDVSA